MNNESTLDWKLLINSTKEVIYLTLLAVLPLIINFFIQVMGTASNCPFNYNELASPSELLTYCLSFLSPTLYLILVKNNGTGYTLPWISTISLVGMIIYLTSFILYLIKKNGFLNLENPSSTYFYFAISFLAITILFRIYSVYHSRRSSSYFESKKEEQSSFNRKFLNKVKGTSHE